MNFFRKCVYGYKMFSSNMNQQVAFRKQLEFLLFMNFYHSEKGLDCMIS